MEPEFQFYWFYVDRPISINSIFLGLGLNLLTLVHSEMFCISSFIIWTSSLVSSEAIVVCVSSAYMVAEENCKQFLKSLRYMTKRRRPRQKPWGIPNLITDFNLGNDNEWLIDPGNFYFFSFHYYPRYGPAVTHYLFWNSSSHLYSSPGTIVSQLGW